MLLLEPRVSGGLSKMTAAERQSVEVERGLQKIAKDAARSGSSSQPAGTNPIYTGDQHSDLRVNPDDAMFLRDPVISPDLRGAIAARVAGKPSFMTDEQWDEAGIDLSNRIDALEEELGPAAGPRMAAALHRLSDGTGPVANAMRRGSFSAENLLNESAAVRIGKALMANDFSMSSLGITAPDRSRAEPDRAAAYESIGKVLGFGLSDPGDEVDFGKREDWFEPEKPRGRLAKFYDMGKADAHRREDPRNIEALDGVKDFNLRSRLWDMRRKLAGASEMKKHAIAESAEMKALARSVAREYKAGRCGSLEAICGGLLSL